MQLNSTLLKLAAPVAAACLAGIANAQDPWTQLSPGGTLPPACEDASTATDGNVMFLAGGKQGTGPFYDGLYSFDGTDWTELVPNGSGFGGRGGHGLCWDPVRSVLVLYGGCTSPWPTALDETWEWTSTTGWTQVFPPTTPGGQWFINMNYVPGLGCVFHGGAYDTGSGVGKYDGTWAYDGSTWTQIATGPARLKASTVYRPAHNDLILYGGTDAAGVKQDETWSLDLTSYAWTEITTATKPTSDNATGGPGLVGYAMYLDAPTGLVILHGGQGNGGQPSSLTWAFNGSDWSDVTHSTDPGPGGRNCYMQYLPTQQKAYLCSYHTGSGYSNDTWEHGATGSSITASATFRTDVAGVNSPVYYATPPVMGSTWTATIDNTFIGNTLAGVVGFATPLSLYNASIGGYILVNVADPGGELLGWPLGFGVGMVSISMTVPTDPILAGYTLSTQGYSGGGGPNHLHNAFDLVLGS